MNSPISPLRYPGGKAKISTFIGDLININNINNCTICELYAGGSGASLSALFSGFCKRIFINDLDYHIYSFWSSILNSTNAFISLIENTPVDMESWYIQKDIYKRYECFSQLEIGFSTLFLNRCNRSGILNAGPIGGKDQNGNYKIDVRFNKRDIINRILAIAERKNKIEVRNIESIDFLREIFSNTNEPYLIFLDPPYYMQGENLYYNFYTDNDHKRLAIILNENRNSNWLLTYDNCEKIKDLYSTFNKAYLPMTYTLQDKRKSKELMIFSDNLYIPKTIRIGSRSKLLSIANI